MKILLIPALALLLSANAQAELKLWGTCHVTDTFVQQKLGYHVVPGCTGTVYKFYRDEETNKNKITRTANPSCESNAFTSEDVSMSRLRTTYWMVKIATGTVCN